MLTAAQICLKARSIAKMPGAASQSGQDLNLVLRDLVLHRDLKMNRVSSTLSVTSGSNGPFNLQTDYLRTYDLFFPLNGLSFFLKNVDTQTYDAEFKSPSVANYPYEFTTDLTPLATQGTPLIYIYPQTNAALTLTHRYMIDRAEISAPETSATVPWFPDQDYLVMAVAMRMMRLTDDARYSTYVTDCDNLLRTHIIMEGDEQDVVKAVTLDPQRFRLRRQLRMTKITG